MLCAAKNSPKSNQQNSTPKSATADSPPPAGDRFPAASRFAAPASIHARPRRIGTLGAPTSSSAHGSALPVEDRYPGSADVLVGTRFSSARGGQVPWERRRPRRHTAQPCPRGTGALGAPTSFSAHGSAPPAGDRCPGSADVLVGTRFSPARGGQAPWERRRPRRHTVQSRPRRTGDGAPTTRCVRWVHSRLDRCAASQSLQFGFLCSAKKRTEQKPKQAPRVPGRVPVRVLVSPAGGGGHAPPVAAHPDSRRIRRERGHVVAPRMCRVVTGRFGRDASASRPRATRAGRDGSNV
jgi:hypothetical protein